MNIIQKLLNIINSRENAPETPSYQDSIDINTRSYLKHIKTFWNMYSQEYSDENIADATKDEYLFYGTVLMLWACRKATPVGLPGDYPVYFIRECHISNPQKLHIQLIEDGYFGEPNIYDIISNYKMDELRVIADSVGCKKSGTKQDLVHRIIENLDNNDIARIINDSHCYSLAQKGIDLLAENYDYVKLHKNQNFNISLYEYNNVRIPDGIRKRTFEDSVFCILSNRIYTNCVKHHYRLMGADHLALYQITVNEHHIDIALDSYLRYLYLKSCCVRAASYRTYTIPAMNNNFGSEIVFTAKTAQPLIELSKFYNDGFVKYIYKDLSLPPSFLSETEFCSAINEMLTETIFDYEKYNQLIRDRLYFYWRN